MTNPRPCDAETAELRASYLLNHTSNKVTGYRLGTGDYRPVTTAEAIVDLPWTHDKIGILGCDCAGFALSWCYKLPRHRDGFNRGMWATVSDDINSNSAIEDADHHQELFRRVAAPMVGDLLVYPTFYLPGHARPWIGHAAIVRSIARAGSWDPARPAYHLLDIIQVCGGQDRKPAAIATDGHVFDYHDATWDKPLHPTGMMEHETPVSVKTVMLRVLP